MGFMKTEQEQIKAIKQIIDERVETTLGQVQGRHDNVIKTVDTVIIARDIVEAGYGNVSEYKSEIERLKVKTSNIHKDTAREILNMLYDIGIDKETLECCRIFDVNGVSLAKQICEKYGVEIEK
jgi:hypothetical protein